MTVEQIEALMVLMGKHRIDHVEVEGVKLTKTLHLVANAVQARPPATDEDDEDELLNWSAPS